jgi:hypothetical protein
MDGETRNGGEKPDVPGDMLARVKCIPLDWFLVALLTAAVVVVYGRTLHFAFVSWDDPRHVCNNAFVREGVTLHSIRAAFTTPLTFHWHPVTMLSHMLDVELFGLHAGGHHATNVLLHLLNTILLFFLFRAMSGGPWLSALLAALFAVHPLHVENVAWISERKDLLCAFFGLLAVHAYLQYVRRGRRIWLVATSAFFLLGLLSKSMLVTLPLVLLLLDYWPLGRLWPPEIGVVCDEQDPLGRKRVSAGEPVLALLREKLPLFALAGVFMLISFLVLQAASERSRIDRVALPLRLLNGAVSYAWYSVKTVWPTNLAADYVHPYLPGGTPWTS